MANGLGNWAGNEWTAAAQAASGRSHRRGARLGLGACLAWIAGCTAAPVAEPSAAPLAVTDVAPAAPAFEGGNLGTPAPVGAEASCLAQPAASMPQLLSELGCFDGGDARWLAPGVASYTVNAPLWTDGAEKERWLSVPAGAAIGLDPNGDFLLPPGTVLGKTFMIGETRVETRILMNDPTQGWHGVSYRWNEQGSDATLVSEQGEKIAAVGPNAQPWAIPARGQCRQCHTAETNVSLGLEVAQLERDFTDPQSGESGNQLDRMIARGWLDGAHATLADPTRRPKLADWHDATQPVAARARAYLHANCSSCHTSAEAYCTGDFRWTASDAEMGVCNTQPKQLDPSFGWPAGTQLVTPGDPERSALVHRVRAPGGSLTAMPPMGRNGVHEDGVALLTQWIAEMRACTP